MIILETFEKCPHAVIPGKTGMTSLTKCGENQRYVEYAVAG